MKTLPSINGYDQAANVYDQLVQERAKNRAEETQLQARLVTAKMNPVILNNDIGGNLAKILPPTISPKNIGNFDSQMWDFTYPLPFDFGTDPVFTPNTRVKKTFRVNQEGAFLLCAISRVYQSKGNAGKGAPLLVSIQANQIDKRYNDFPFPIQNIGSLGSPLMLPTPLLIQKNTSVDVELTSFVGADFEAEGDGYHELAFIGYKVRNEEDLKLLQTLFT